MQAGRASEGQGEGTRHRQEPHHQRLLDLEKDLLYSKGNREPAKDFRHLDEDNQLCTSDHQHWGWECGVGGGELGRSPMAGSTADHRLMCQSRPETIKATLRH